MWDLSVNDIKKIIEGSFRGMTIKEAAKTMGVHERTIIRMLEDGRLSGKLIDIPPNRKLWLIDPVDIAKLIVRKEDLGKKQYPRANKKEGKHAKKEG